MKKQAKRRSPARRPRAVQPAPLPKPPPAPRLACCGGWSAHKRSCTVCPPLYEPAEGDHPALQRSCPACKAPRGSWCGGFGDVHLERMTKAQRAARQAELEAQAAAVLEIERSLQER